MLTTLTPNAAPAKQIKVLIVDDSSVMRKIIERALRQAGLDLSEVLEASNRLKRRVKSKNMNACFDF